MYTLKKGKKQQNPWVFFKLLLNLQKLYIDLHVTDL
jgi:hypothetical protein